MLPLKIAQRMLQERGSVDKQTEALINRYALTFPRARVAKLVKRLETLPELKLKGFNGPAYRLTFSEVSRHLGPKGAFRLLEKADLADLQAKAALVAAWSSRLDFFFQWGELFQLLRDFDEHIEVSREPLLADGHVTEYASEYFSHPSIFFDLLHLNNPVYPAKRDIPELVCAGYQGKMPWMEYQETPEYKIKCQTYAERQIFNSVLPKDDVAFLEDVRSRPYRLKRELFPKLGQAIWCADGIADMRREFGSLAKITPVATVKILERGKLIENIVSEHIAKAFSAPEYDRLIALEKNYAEASVWRHVEWLRQSGSLYYRQMPSGGLSSLITAVAMLQHEITTDRANTVKADFLELTGGKEMQSYFQLLGAKNIKAVDKFLVEQSDYFSRSVSEEDIESLIKRMRPSRHAEAAGTDSTKLLAQLKAMLEDSRRHQTPREESFAIPPLSETEKCKYRNYPRKDIIGFKNWQAGSRSYELLVNGKRERINYPQFLVLLYLAIALKKDSHNGWVSVEQAMTDAVVDPEDERAFAREVTELNQRLSRHAEPNSAKFIQNLRGESKYRLSTMPSRIKAPDTRWLKNKFSEIRREVIAERNKRIRQIKESKSLPKVS
ncbi:MAG: hypothetical protein WC532_09045 [Candidatus Omnitrophota bacterium]